MKETKIEWAHATFNPWWGCVEVSPGCRKCYARDFDRRTHGTSKHVTASGETREPHWGKDAPRRFFGEKHWRAPLAWDRAAERAMNAAERGQAGGASGCLPHRPRVFCASMADVFEDRPDLVEPRARLFRLIEDTPNLDWLLLTKRPENILRLLPTGLGDFGESVVPIIFPNVWLGTTCEDQQRADERIPHLLAVPAAVRFLSVEPMLGPVDLEPFLSLRASTRWCWPCGFATNRLGEPCPNCGAELTADRRVDWVIVGGESGHGARPFDIAWARDIVRQTREAGVACFVKQLGAWPVLGECHVCLGRKPAEVRDVDTGAAFLLPCTACGGTGREAGALIDSKGGDPAEWPEDLRVRQFPKGGAA